MAWKIWGNYCGPGWTGGVSVVNGAPGNYRPVHDDVLDLCCKNHDMLYERAMYAFNTGEVSDYWNQIMAADRKMLADVTFLIESLEGKLDANNYQMYRMAEGIQSAFILKTKLYNKTDFSDLPLSPLQNKFVDDFLRRNWPLTSALFGGYMQDLYIATDVNRKTQAALNWTPPPADPLVLDLNACGVRSASGWVDTQIQGVYACGGGRTRRRPMCIPMHRFASNPLTSHCRVTA